MKLGIAFSHRLGPKKKRLTREHVARLKKALELYGNGTIDAIAVSGTRPVYDPHGGTPFNQRSRNWLVRRGVPRDRIILISGRLTLEEAAYLRQAVAQHRPDEIHVVSSDWHLQRAAGTVKAMLPGIAVTGHGVGGFPVPDDEASEAKRRARDFRYARRMEGKWRRGM